MRFASLGSGSEGNGLLVESDVAGAGRPLRVLVDCGFQLKEVARRLERLGLTLEDMHAVLVTHEHGDHVGGVCRLARATGVPVYLTHGTAHAARRMGVEALVEARQVRWIDPHTPFELEGLRIEPVAVPHDAREPVQFVFDDGRRRLGVVTDLGHATPHVVRMLSRLDCLVLEANHDPAMLGASDYPWVLKRRIAGPYGHLGNDAAAQLLGAIDHARLSRVVAAHLSRQNNLPELARAALALAWGVTPERIDVADQDDGFAWMDV